MYRSQTPSLKNALKYESGGCLPSRWRVMSVLKVYPAFPPHRNSHLRNNVKVLIWNCVPLKEPNYWFVKSTASTSNSYNPLRIPLKPESWKGLFTLEFRKIQQVNVKDLLCHLYVIDLQLSLSLPDNKQNCSLRRVSGGLHGIPSFFSSVFPRELLGSQNPSMTFCPNRNYQAAHAKAQSHC